MKKILFLFLFLFGLSAHAAQIITATVSVTNAAGTTNGQTITINGNVRTWTNSVSVPASQILTNSTPEGSATNLFLQIASYPITGLTLSRTTSTNVVLKTSPGFILTVSVSAGWGEVSYSTNETTSATVVRVPPTVEVNSVRTNVASGVVAYVNDAANTNAIQQMSKAAEQLVGTTNTQTITGNKYFSGSIILSNQAGVIVSGTIWATNFSGIVANLTNGVWRSGTLLGPLFSEATVTNGIAFNGIGVYQDPPSDDGIVVKWNPTTATLDFIGEAGYTNLSIPFNDGSPMIARYGVTSHGPIVGDGTGISNVVSVTTQTNLIVRGTNNIPIGGDIAFGRYALTTLANGNNAAIPVGTNVFVEVSGPSSAFTINGINGSPNRDGKYLILVNMTGQNMTIAHDSGTDPTAANRIYTMTGSDHATTGNGAAMLIYSGAASRWILLSLNP